MRLLRRRFVDEASEVVAAAEVSGASVGIEQRGMDEPAAPAADASYALERVLAQMTGWTLADAVEAVPGVERVRALAERVEPRGGVDEVVDVVGCPTEVLGGEAHARLAREHT